MTSNSRNLRESCEYLMKCESHGLCAVPDHLSHFSSVPREANLDESSIDSLAIRFLGGFGHLEIPAEEKGREERV